MYDQINKLQLCITVIYFLVFLFASAVCYFQCALYSAQFLGVRNANLDHNENTEQIFSVVVVVIASVVFFFFLRRMDNAIPHLTISRALPNLYARSPEKKRKKI